MEKERMAYFIAFGIGLVLAVVNFTLYAKTGDVTNLNAAGLFGIMSIVMGVIGSSK